MSETKQAAAEVAVDPKAAMVLAKAMWRVENENLPEDAGARNQLFAQARKDYRAKARRVLRMASRKGLQVTAPAED